MALAGCSVCKERLGAEESVARANRCGHLFHWACVSEWVRVSRSSGCPDCRARLPLERDLQPCFVTEAVEPLSYAPSSPAHDGSDGSSGSAHSLKQQLQEARSTAHAAQQQLAKERSERDSLLVAAQNERDKARDQVTRERASCNALRDRLKQLEHDKNSAELTIAELKQQLRHSDSSLGSSQSQLVELLQSETSKLDNGVDPRTIVEGLCRRVARCERISMDKDTEYWRIIRESRALKAKLEEARAAATAAQAHRSRQGRNGRSAGESSVADECVEVEGDSDNDDDIAAVEEHQCNRKRRQPEQPLQRKFRRRGSQGQDRHTTRQDSQWVTGSDGWPLLDRPLDHCATARPTGTVVAAASSVQPKTSLAPVQKVPDGRGGTMRALQVRPRSELSKKTGGSSSIAKKKQRDKAAEGEQRSIGTYLQLRNNWTQ